MTCATEHALTGSFQSVCDKHLMNIETDIMKPLVVGVDLFSFTLLFIIAYGSHTAPSTRFKVAVNGISRHLKGRR
jgi:hypothetical protein